MTKLSNLVKLKKAFGLFIFIKTYHSTCIMPTETLTGSFGNIIKDYDYNPYGVEETDPVNKFGKYATISLWQQEIEKIDNPFRYCGEYYDQETGSIYLRARYYDPGLRQVNAGGQL